MSGIRNTFDILSVVSGYKNDELLFESNTPGIYEFKPKSNCICEITIVGAGAGGAFNSSSNRPSAAAGSSGSGCIALVLLKAGKTYKIIVGKGGNPSGGKDANVWGGVGENSKIILNDEDLILAPGGNGGHVWWPNAAAAATPPALCTFTENSELFTVIDILLNRQGITGGTSTAPGGASVIDGTDYGHGGSATSAGGGSTATAGKPGYVKIISKRLKIKYYKYVLSDWAQPIMTADTQEGCELTGKNINGNLFNLFNGLDGGNGYVEAATSATYGSVVVFKSSEMLKVSKIAINYQDQYNVTYGFTSFKITAIVDGNEVLITTSIPGRLNAWATTEFPVNELMTKELRFYMSSQQSPWVRIGEITISAHKVDIVQGSVKDYDFIAYEE